ncbi:Hypothetical predicted protein, partial [Paramuricea clavata]
PDVAPVKQSLRSLVFSFRMLATRPSTRVQRRAQPAAPRRSATTMQQPESSGVSCEASSSVATTSAPDAASPATNVPDETVQWIVSAVSQAVPSVTQWSLRHYSFAAIFSCGNEGIAYGSVRYS